MTTPDDITRETGAILFRSSPGLLATAWTWNGIVAILTVIFLLLQIAHFLWKWRRDIRRAEDDRDDEDGLETLAERHHHPEDE